MSLGIYIPCTSLQDGKGMYPTARVDVRDPSYIGPSYRTHVHRLPCNINLGKATYAWVSDNISTALIRPSLPRKSHTQNQALHSIDSLRINHEIRHLPRTWVTATQQGFQLLGQLLNTCSPFPWIPTLLLTTRPAGWRGLAGRRTEAAVCVGNVCYTKLRK